MSLANAICSFRKLKRTPQSKFIMSRPERDCPMNVAMQSKKIEVFQGPEGGRLHDGVSSIYSHC